MDNLSLNTDTPSLIKDAGKLVHINNSIRDKIEKMEKDIKNYQNIIKENERDIFFNCEHTWLYEKTEYSRSVDVCKNCGLYNNEYMYR